MRHIALITTILLLSFSCQTGNRNTSETAYDESADTLRYEGESHLKNVQQITFGGNNAEAYWNFAGDQLTFQSDYSEWGVSCDQIFLHNLAPTKSSEVPPMISTGAGRTTCSYFLPGDEKIVYASTHAGSEVCPPVPPRSIDGKYVWPVYPDYDIYVADLNGNIVDQLTNEPGYDAEATVSPKGDKIVFTSTRTGDLELFTMNIDGSEVTQITSELGYDGGAFFSPDGQKLVFRASRPKTEEDINIYQGLLDQGLVQPTNMEIFVCNVDGSEMTQITELGNANWAPFFHPSGNKILFSSNHGTTRGFPFNLYLINVDGTGLEKVTQDNVFDSFPMFSPDGKKLVWSSNRFNGGNRDTNLFLADWVD